ncbi:sulfite exporter TauE/SafE family protein [Tardiphaga sp. 619_E2_N8_5]|jgi:uncharacterized membrane protein YfcA|uniref:sulfite exporter TauE/SafE family protein n=1 Tax=unclassified Tardiphaga TaxID=2631404 RepID=UPI003F285C19
MTLTDVLGGLLAGGVGGMASGLLGITSGGILVPLLVLLLGKDQHVAQGVSLVVQVVPTSLSGVRNYQRSGHHVPPRWLAWLAIGFAVGGCVGALLATTVSARALQWTFVGYLLVLEVIVIRRPSHPKLEGTADEAKEVPLRGSALVAIGAVAGWSSGFLGIGGGLAITALMTGLLKVSQHQSQALSLAVTALPVTLPAALLYVQQGIELPWLTIASLIIGLWIGTGLGSRLANRMSQRALRMTLIAVIAGMAVFMAFKAAI